MPSQAAAKNLDMVAANWVGEGKAFEQDDNALEVFWPGGRRTLPTASKAVLAGRLIDLIAERYGARAAV